MVINQEDKSIIGLSFRPSIVIFAGPGIEGVYTSLKSLVLSFGLAEPLRKCIGFIRAQSIAVKTRPTAQYWFLSDMFVPGSSTHSDILEATALPFEVVLELVRQEVMSSHNQDAIKEKGYTIPDKPPQIYIVGDPASPAPGNILKSLRTLSPEAKVFYILCPGPTQPSSSLKFPSLQAEQPLLSAHASSHAEKRAVADFCYLYEFPQTQSTLLKEELRDYAVAQALCMLLTTSISAHNELSSAIADAIASQTQQEPQIDAHFGTLSTCLISSPYEDAKTFCDAYLASELVTWWKIHDRKANVFISHIPSNQQAEPHAPDQDASEHDHESILLPAQDNPLPLDNNIQQVSTWEHVSEQQSFSFPTINEINTTYKKMHKIFIPHEWVQCLANAANDRYQQWTATTSMAWKTRSSQVCEQLSKTIEYIWQNPHNEPGMNFGPEASKLYLDSANTLLTNLEQLFTEQQAPGKEKYNQSLKNIGKHFYTPPDDAILDDQEKLVAFENSIEKQFIEELTTQHAKMPPSNTRIAASAVMATVLFLMFLTLLSQISVLLLIGSIIIVSIIANVLYALYYQRKKLVIQNALLDYYSCRYRYLCEQFEHNQQVLSVKDLKTEVVVMLNRIIWINEKLVQLKGSLRAEAESLKAEFFQRPVVSHDVYLSNGNLLQRDRPSTITGYIQTLEAFADIMLDQADTLKKLLAYNQWDAYLYKWMQDKTLEFNLQEAREKALAAAQISTANTSADKTIGLANLKAEENTDIWNYLCRYRLKPLTRLPLNKPPSYIFLWGDTLYLDRGKRRIEEFFPDAKVIIVHTKNDAYILAAAFYGDCVPPAATLDTLFPTI